MELTAKSHSVTMNNGLKIPLLGIGTYGDPRTVRGCLFIWSDIFLMGFCFLLREIHLF